MKALKIVFNAAGFAGIVASIVLSAANGTLRSEVVELRKDKEHMRAEYQKLRYTFEQQSKAPQANALPSYDPPNPGKHGLVYTYTK